MLKYVIFLLFLYESVFSYVFQFKDMKDDSYRIVSSSIQEAYIDNVKVGVYDHGYKAILRVMDVKENYSLIKGQYFYMAKPYGKKESYQIVEEKIYQSEFKRFFDGKMEIGSEYFYPVIRNLPVFPNRDIAIGESWEGEGFESQDFTKIGIPKPFIVPFTVRYMYEKDEIKEGVEYAVIKLSYTINYNMGHRINPHFAKGYPVRVMGFFDGRMHWDKKAGNIKYYNGDYNFIYIFSNGEIREWKGKDSGEVTIIRESKEDTKKIEQEAKQEIGKMADIKEAEEGLKLIFSDILFDFNKVNLKEEVKPVLDKVVEILKKYPQYEVRVEGHSDNIGQEAYKKAIAERRAKTVADYMVSQGIDPKRISFMGWSDKKPLVPNDTEENRSKNRRVEIYIITK